MDATPLQNGVGPYALNAEDVSEWTYTYLTGRQRQILQNLPLHMSLPNKHGQRLDSILEEVAKYMKVEDHRQLETNGASSPTSGAKVSAKVGGLNRYFVDSGAFGSKASPFDSVSSAFSELSAVGASGSALGPRRQPRFFLPQREPPLDPPSLQLPE